MFFLYLDNIRKLVFPLLQFSVICMVATYLGKTWKCPGIWKLLWKS